MKAQQSSIAPARARPGEPLTCTLMSHLDGGTAALKCTSKRAGSYPPLPESAWLTGPAGLAFQKDIFGPKEANQTFDVNYWGVKNVIDAVAPLLKENGRIVTVSSRCAQMPAQPYACISPPCASACPMPCACISMATQQPAASSHC